MNSILSARNSVIVVLIACISVIGLWSYTKASGTEITACVGKNGIVSIIGEGFKQTDCSDNETPISWNIQGPQGPKGDKGETGDVGPKGDMGDQGEPGISGTALHVFDANNQDVGILLNVGATFDGPFAVYVPSAGAFVEMEENGNSKTVTIRNTAAIIFTENDCQGLPYSSSYRNPGATSFVGSRAFKTIEGPFINLPSASRLTAVGCENIQGLDNLAPVVEINLPFTLPLAWPLKIQQI